MPSKVQLQVELVEKSAEARLKALDKLAKEMGNRKITLNFDEASLARWKAATDNMSAAQISAYAKLAAAAENANAKMVAAGQKSVQVEMQQNAKLVTERQKSIDKKIELYEKEDTKRRQIAEKTAQTEIKANEKIQVATLKGVQGTRQQTQAQKELNAEAGKTSGIFDQITSRFTAANLISSLITAAVSKLRQALRQAVDEMKEMDKELTTIKMVTGASDSDISALRQQAFQGARETGRTTSDYLSAAERFARAGYRENIQDLTKLSLVTQNVGGVTEDVASKFILAADAAWKMGGNTDRLWSMLDGVTAIADQNATDIGKIAEAYTVAGSAFANAGESERTFAALIGTTTAATQRSGSEMARGLQTILFRVRQVKGELDDGEIIDADSISNAAKALDSVGISVLNDSNELKSFSEIMGELNKKWDTLNSKQKAYIQNALAGNRRGNVLFSLMDNWDVFEKQSQQFDEASGTALEKNEIYLDSWQAAQDKLNTTWTETVSLMTDSGGALQNLVIETEKLLSTFNKIRNWEKDNSNYFQTASENGWLTPEDIMMYQDFGIITEETERKVIEYTKEQERANNDLAKATIQVIKAYNDEAEAVDQLSTAFQKADANIKKAAENMKDEKDSSIKSAADIFKAMNEAAQKGYYGSNKYKSGIQLFFGTTDKSKIKDSAKKALETYFKEIEKGDYSNAAANLWKKLSGEDGSIRDKNGEVIASMKDLGDAFKWTFDKGGKGIDNFLESMQESTGISSDFWASLIKSLGMYSDELDNWMEDHKESPEPDITLSVDNEEAKSKLDEINGMLEKLPKEQQVEIKLSLDGMSVQDAYNYVKNIVDGYTSNKPSNKEAENAIKSSVDSVKELASTWDEVPKEVTTEADAQTSGAKNKIQNIIDLLQSIPKTVVSTVIVNYENAGGGGSGGTDKFSGGGAGHGFARGKRDSYSGIALVNDEFPADGSKPELIISKSTGRAYIANGGKPALVNLRSDDIVLTANETKDAVGFPQFDTGKNDSTSKNNSLADWISGGASTEGDSDGGFSVTTPSGTTAEDIPATKKKKKGNSKQELKNWEELKKLVDYLLEKGERELKNQLKVLDKQLEELEAERKQRQEEKQLEEKQLAVQQALVDLEKAQNERTVRYYNEETQQWEWMADQGDINKAQEALDSAQKELADYQDELEYQSKKDAIEQQKQELQDQFDELTQSWADIVDAIEAPAGDLQALLEKMFKASGTMGAEAGSIADLLNVFRDGIFGSGYSEGLNRINANTDKSTTTIETVFGTGKGSSESGEKASKGILTDAVIGPEVRRSSIILSEPDIFADIGKSLQKMVDGAGESPVPKGISKIVNNNGGNFYLNGIQVGQEMYNRPFVEVLKALSIHANENR